MKQLFAVFLCILIAVLGVQILVSVLVPLLFPNGLPDQVPNGLIPLALSLIHLGAMMVGLRVFPRVEARLEKVAFLARQTGRFIPACLAVFICLTLFLAIGILVVQTIVFLN